MSAQTPNSFNTQNKEPKSRSTNPKLILISTVGVLLLAGIAGTALIMSNTPEEKSENVETLVTMSQSDNRNDDRNRDNIDQPSAANQGTTNTAVDVILEEGREKVSQYNAQKPEIKVEEVTASEVFAVEQVKTVKEEVRRTQGEAVAPSVQADTTKKMSIQIQYSNVGDEPFADGSLYIRLSDGLRIVADSITDNTSTGLVSVNNSVYDSGKNLIKYLPASGDKTSGLIAVGQRGTLSFIVEFVKPDIEVYGVTSYLQDKDGETGVPGFIFLENK
jgi:hypothetical protein